MNRRQPCIIRLCSNWGTPKPPASFFACDHCRQVLFAVQAGEAAGAFPHQGVPALGRRPILEKHLVAGGVFMVAIEQRGEVADTGMVATRTPNGFAWGRVGRVGTLDDYRAWEQQVFPGWPSMLRGAETFFAELELG